MQIKSLTFSNFKGIKELTVPFEKTTTVLGANGTGKTTILDGFLYLFTGKNSEFKDLEPKTLNPDGSEVHGTDHEVEGLFSANGKDFSLKKVYQEKWTKPRGSAQKIFSGNTVKHFIDGIPKSKKEYDEFVSGIMSEETIRLLSCPDYFSSVMSWQARRELLFKVCADVVDISDERVIGSDESLADLLSILSGKTMEEYKKLIAMRRTKINKELDTLPARVDENKRKLPDISGIDSGAEIKLVAEHKSLIAALVKQIAKAEAGGETGILERKLADLETEIIKTKNDYRAELDKVIERARAEKNKAAGVLAADNQLVADIEEKIKVSAAVVDDTEPNLLKLKKSFAEAQAEFNLKRAEVFDTDKTCQACGQALPADKIDAAVAAFNARKADTLKSIREDLDGINTRGGVISKQRDAAQDEIATLKERLAAAKEKALESRTLAESRQTYLAGLLAERDTAKPPGLAELLKMVEDTKEEIKQVKQGRQSAVIENLQTEKEAAEKDLSVCLDNIKAVEDHGNISARIQELLDTERTLSAELEKIEGQQHMLDCFTRVKTGMIEDAAASKFELARFKLFDQHLNDSISDCCEVLYKGVPYNSGLNRGAQIVVGLDIIKTLSAHFDVSVPIFVDGAESVHSLPEMDAQVIRLVVDEGEPALRVV